ncbi:hypothetical protein PDIDSM_1166 [Penicillium digitatum]|nr:hypothetical protein PDIDSM_1166 [Penicillium digitatum]
MTDTLRISTVRFPPLRQARGRRLSSFHTYTAVISPKLRLQTSGFAIPTHARLARLMSPLSAGTTSSCSDTEWQSQMQGFRGYDDLYDASGDDSDDNETEISDSCFSPDTRPSSLITPVTRNSGSPVRRRLRPRFQSRQQRCRCSAVLCPHHTPPSLDGSMTSDQESIISALATPDSQSLPETHWDAHDDIRVRRDLDGIESGLENADGSSDLETVPIAIEDPHDDWRHVLGSFPRIPTAAHAYSPPLPPSLSPSFHLNDEPIHNCDDIYDAPQPIHQRDFLPNSAMATLHHIHLDETIDSWSETSEDKGEMWQLQQPLKRPRSADGVTPASELSGYSFSDLSIPSPERFYNLPWRQDEGEIVEQIVEWPRRPVDEDPVTAVRDEEAPLTAVRLPCDTPTLQEIPRSANGYEYDECYDQELQERAVANHDRTSIWLSAQASYLSALNETNPVNGIKPVEPSEKSDDVEAEAEDTTEDSSKKMVRFSEGVPESLGPLPPVMASKDSIYWQGFRSIRERSTKTDGFMHRNMRFDAVQSMRLAMNDLHINCLLGKFELVRPERPAYKGPFAKAPRNSMITSELAEKAQFDKVEKEQLVLAQLSQPMWAMDASGPSTARRISQGPRKRSFRILDLGGHSSCDWAWQAAHEFPNVKVYTVASKNQAVNSAIKGPPNHRQVTVANLWELPFGNNQFDLISARSMHALLKIKCPAGKDRDEYDLVLKECMRCLRPGGYLEFQLLDAEISRAGPHASATSVEFAFNLRNRGYDPLATKSFVGRLRSTGFVNTQRAWMFLPMGTEPVEQEPLRETPAPRVQSQIENCEAVQGPIGSTADIASMTGLIGGWMWEQWLLKLRVEMGRDRSLLLEGLGALFNEGRKSGAGWTCLSGWAMKPKRKSSVSLAKVGSM